VVTDLRSCGAVREDDSQVTARASDGLAWNVPDVPGMPGKAGFRVGIVAIGESLA
jgi:hypothetical protein